MLKYASKLIDKVRQHAAFILYFECLGLLWIIKSVKKYFILKMYHSAAAAAAAAKSLQSCPTLCDPIDSSPPGSPIRGILQARTLEWVAISFSNAWKWKVKVKSLSCVQLLATLWTAACEAPPSMGFSRQEYWSGINTVKWLLKSSQLAYPSSYSYLFFCGENF